MTDVMTLAAMEAGWAVGIAVLCLAGGFGLSWLIQHLLGKSKIQKAEQAARALLDDADKRAAAIIKSAEVEAKAEIIQKREQFEQETSKVRDEMRDLERHLSKREDTVDRKWDALTNKENDLGEREKKLVQNERNISKRQEQIAHTLEEQKAELVRIAGISPDEAKEMLLKRIEDDVSHETSVLIERLVNTAREEAEQRSREITINAMQRYAADHTCDSTVSTVDIPSDDMKGRVIGREGRNIRAFEKATGVDVIIDDTPGVVVVSAFDPIRREVARRSLEKLIQDGRIHPARIEEVAAETQEEVEAQLLDLGKKVTLEANIHGLHGKLLPYLGRLNYRSSYGQNVLRHSVEVAFLAQAMADELGLDGNLARRAGLLHDIGKAADHEIEGGHPAVGADIVKRFGESNEIVNALAGHHGDVPPISPYTPLIAAADAMSASRPGARRETLERYIKRLENLERLATSFKGIKQAYAIQAGREVRVIVDPNSVNDEDAWKTARDIAKKVEEELTYPGEVKVTLLREVRCVEYAR